MKMLGKSSVSSVLRSVLSIIWLLFIGLGLLLFAATMATLVKPTAIDFDSYKNFSFLYSVPTKIEAKAVQIESSDPDIVEAEIVPLGNLKFRTSSRLYMVVFWVMIYITYALILYSLYQLIKFFDSLGTGHPFVKENARRIKRIGLAILGMEALRIVGTLGLLFYFNSIFSTANTSVYLTSLKEAFQLGNIFLGIVILIIAEIFRLGTKMKEEQELTV